VTWDRDVLRFASGAILVEYDLPRVRGFLVNLAEPITGMTASTIRIVFEDPASSERSKMPEGTLESLPVVSANPAYAESVRQIGEVLSRSQVPVPTSKSLADLRSGR
jgi:hypothetical protein